MTVDSPRDRERWNAKFLRGEAQSVDPDALLIEACSDVTPGRALDLAGGAGRHALWLARRGWNATLADVSDEGPAIAAQRAAEAGLALPLRREPAAETLAWASHHPFDLIVVFWCLLREDLPALPLALVPAACSSTRPIPRTIRAVPKATPSQPLSIPANSAKRSPHSRPSSAANPRASPKSWRANPITRPANKKTAAAALACAYSTPASGAFLPLFGFSGSGSGFGSREAS